MLFGPTSLVVLQPTPFCNLDCSYCYLGSRTDHRRMSLGIVKTVFGQLFDLGVAAPKVVLAWHAGEPLTVPRSFYREAHAAIERLRPPDVEVQHNFQTNATLVDEAWCQLFIELGAKIGVSIDGPASLHDTARRTRNGRGTHARVMRGISRLARSGIPFEAIAVVRRPTLSQAAAFTRFFIDTGIRSLALNIEEVEGANTVSSMRYPGVEADYKAFLRVVETAGRGRLRVRELEDTRLALLAIQPRSSGLYHPGATVTVDWQGNFSLFAPELLGASHPDLGSLDLGNVATTTLLDAAASDRCRAILREMQRGLAACARSCAYYRYCAGNSPSNKLFELGTFDGTETLDCRLNRMAVADIMLEALEADVAAHPACGRAGT
jgi:uncharacterized protein